MAEKPTGVTFEKAGTGFVNEGKNGKYIKLQIAEGVELKAGDKLYAFPNDKPKTDKSPDYFLNIRRGG